MFRTLVFCALVVLIIANARNGLSSIKPYLVSNTSYATLSRCSALETNRGADRFTQRSSSDRFVPGTKPILIKGARVWTGEKNGTEVVNGDVLLDKGIIQGLGRLAAGSLSTYGDDLVVIDANGAWITPGLIDVRSHHGISPSPRLAGAVDVKSFHSTIQPWLRSVDALNTHDDGYLLSIAGGTTTALVLPGFSSAVGGEGYAIKLRDTNERSPTSMLLEPHLPTDASSTEQLPRRRYVVHSCGESPGNVHNDTRMDNMWALRYAYTQARVAMQRQDDYCSKTITEEFPEDYEWELLVEVLKGNVKVHVHCNEIGDLDDIIQLSREFRFPIAAIHSGSDAYLAPRMLRRAYGQPPALALAATDGRKQREKYRASEFAPRILAEHGFTVLMQSQLPGGADARYLLYEAQKAFFYGLPANLAIASVSSAPAEAIGMAHRIGYIKQGWDADLVIWDSHPMALGATPSQVVIDGIPQLDPAFARYKPNSFQELPKVPNFDNEVQKTIEYGGLPPLIPKKSSKTVVLTNVTSVYSATSLGVKLTSPTNYSDPFAVVVSESGELKCSGSYETCLNPELLNDASIVDLHGGSIAPAFVSFGSSLGLEHIRSEMSTNDGVIVDPLFRNIPLVGGDAAIVQAADGLKFGSRNALLAYRAGVTSAITAPSHKGFYAGLSAQFSTDAMHRMERGAIKEEVVAIHVSVRHFGHLSVSTQITALRRLLSGSQGGAASFWFGRVLEGTITLVVETHSADIIATLIILKQEVELRNNKSIRMTITGAAEAHKLAKELAEAHIGVIITPFRQSPKHWESRRILPGAPLTSDGAIDILLSHGVLVGIGVDETSSTQNLRFDVAWASIEAGKRMSKEETIALASVNIEQLLGTRPRDVDLIVTRGGDILDFGSQVVGVVSRQRGQVHLLT